MHNCEWIRSRCSYMLSGCVCEWHIAQSDSIFLCPSFTVSFSLFCFVFVFHITFLFTLHKWTLPLPPFHIFSLFLRVSMYVLVLARNMLQGGNSFFWNLFYQESDRKKMLMFLFWSIHIRWKLQIMIRYRLNYSAFIRQWIVWNTHFSII